VVVLEAAPFAALLLGLRRFCHSLVNIHSYRSSEGYLSPTTIELRSEEETKEGLRFRQMYLDDRFVAAYSAAFLLPFAVATIIFYRQVKKLMESPS
jgi:hypothetical protein